VTEFDVVAAYKHSSHHRRELEASEHCGYFYCLAMFGPAEITLWLNQEDDGTAQCPLCCIDSVIGSASGLPITREFLGEMHRQWFNEPPPGE